jgi:hypothetical protein
MPSISTRPVRFPTASNQRPSTCNAHVINCHGATQQQQQPAWHVPASLALAAAASLSLVATPVLAVSGGKGISSYPHPRLMMVMMLNFLLMEKHIVIVVLIHMVMVFL